MDINEKLIMKIRENTVENRISCEKAMEIADDNGISPSELGKLLNELKIKIRKCQFGCF